METDVNTPSSSVKKQEMESVSGETSSDQPVSKIPRPSKPCLKVRKIKDDDLPQLPQSVKSITMLENKFKSSMIKYNKEVKEMETISEKLGSIWSSLVKLRDEILERGQKDPPQVPEIPSFLLSKQSDTLHSSKHISDKLQEDNDRLKESLVELTDKYSTETGSIESLKSELPQLSQTIKTLENTINVAHQKQDFLENSLENYKTDIAVIIEDLNQYSSIKKNSELLLKEFNNMQEEYKNENKLFKKELEGKDVELEKAKKNFEIECARRLALENALSKITEEKDSMQKQCTHFSEQTEILKKYQIMAESNIGNQELIAHNAQLIFELDQLKKSLESRAGITRENEVQKEEIIKLINEKELIRSDFMYHCQQTLFDKEKQIYSIKSKMDNIVNLKNNIASREATGEPFFILDVAMNLSNPFSLKNEIMSLHQKLVEAEECKTELENRMSTKDVRIRSLEEELGLSSQAQSSLESLLEAVKRKERENSELICSLPISKDLYKQLDLMKEDDKEKRIKELLQWQQRQREVMSELEKRLKNTEEIHSLAEERRIRNEERIALLQIKLAKYEYYR